EDLIMFPAPFRALCLAAALLPAAVSTSARVISYSPYTDHIAFPATQNRTNRHFVLVETTQLPFGGAVPPFIQYPNGQLVIYDSKGLEEPRVIFPSDTTPVAFSTLAVREENNVSTILIQTNANVNGANASRAMVWFLSTDSGTTWKSINLPTSAVQNIGRFQNDVGGPFVNARFSPVRIGTSAFPFWVQMSTTVIASPTFLNGLVFAVGFDGTVRKVVDLTNATPQIVGTNVDGSLALIRTSGTVSIVDLNGV